MKTLIVISLLAVLNGCNGQNHRNAQTSSGADPSSLHHDPAGTVYFSTDNGLTWQNTSAGLPATVRIGLGGLAASGNTLALVSKDSGLYFFDFPESKWLNTPTDTLLQENNPGALIFYNDRICVGTQFGGVFSSQDMGKSWQKLNAGLNSLSIRKFAVVGHTLHAATNSGLYFYDEKQHQWAPEYESGALQTNGIAAFAGNMYIATVQGVFASTQGQKDWKNVFATGAIHNISADDTALYAMMYNELFCSFDKGETWRSIQKGLPAELYTFNVIQNANTLFAGQWDGVYRKDKKADRWTFSGNGLPENFAVTNMIRYHETLVMSGSERKLTSGMSTDK